MDKTMQLVSAILAGIVGVATVAVIVSRNSATANVLGAAFGGLASVLRVAVSPVAPGGQASLGGPSSGGGAAPFLGSLGNPTGGERFGEAVISGFLNSGVLQQGVASIFDNTGAR